MAIKNIVFDLGNVILNGTPSDILNDFDLNLEEEIMIKNTFFSNCDNLDLGIATLEQHYNSCDLKLPMDIKRKLLDYYMYRRFNEDVLELMKKLRDNGYNIYILSNNNKETVNYLYTLPQFEIVSGWVISCDYNVMKPDSKIYKILFDKYDLNPKECFFIDDKEENIQAGISLGMKGHVLDYKNFGIAKLIEELKELN